MSLYMFMGCVGKKFMERKNVTGNLETEQKATGESYSKITSYMQTYKCNNNTNVHTHEYARANVHIL